MENFSTRTFILILGQIMEKMRKCDSQNPERKNWLIRRDLEFWRTMVSYVPRLDFRTKSDFKNLQRCIQNLDTELMELDFSGVLTYLDFMEGEAERATQWI